LKIGYEISSFVFKHKKDRDKVIANNSLNEKAFIKILNKKPDYVDSKQQNSVGKVWTELKCIEFF